MQYIWCIYAWQAWESAVEATTKINLQVKPRLSVPHLRSNNATIWETGLKGSRGSNPVHNTTCKSFNPSVDWLLLLLLWLLTTAGHAAKGGKCKAQKERRKKKNKKDLASKGFKVWHTLRLEFSLWAPIICLLLSSSTRIPTRKLNHVV